MCMGIVGLAEWWFQTKDKTVKRKKLTGDGTQTRANQAWIKEILVGWGHLKKIGKNVMGNRRPRQKLMNFAIFVSIF